ncbi:uncharacterized protein BP5553_09127 [Venustampulla echinocandica]|uniref:Uncharacterized protein n=1 Tax=Venustampulla echinocandica TaxID=2656787 RepID=A0A370TE17_9HELO|nr:uncharacterized protein BP5553_09127 [Venustampulla echinocandica]RDL32671.1 hypothetical protein BP5553_09127 [Venustampulla echinocandica]
METHLSQLRQHSGEKAASVSTSSLHSFSNELSPPARLAPHLGPLTLDHDLPITPNVSPIESEPGAFQQLTADCDTSVSGALPMQLSRSFVEHQAWLVMEDEAVKYFSSQTRCIFDLFQKSADKFKPVSTGSVDDVVRLAIWWFLDARMKLDPLLREGSSFPFAQEDNKILLQRAHLNLAKSFWILQETNNLNHEASSKNIFESAEFRDADHTVAVLSLRLAVLVRIRQAIWSMQRSELLPLSLDMASISEDADTSIWVSYPSLNLSIDYLITGHYAAPQDKLNEELPLSAFLPLGDTRDAFHYGGMHIDLFLLAESSNAQQIKYPAILSIIRARDERCFSVAIGTQHGLLNFSIHSSRKNQPTWDDVTWVPVINALELKLRTGFRLQLRCSTWDFKILKGMYDYYCQTLLTFQASQDETLLFETGIKSAKYHTSQVAEFEDFPAGVIANCTFRLFEGTLIQQAGTGPRRLHRSFRIAIITPPSAKNITVSSQTISPGRAIQFGFMRGDTGSPTLTLNIDTHDAERTWILDFDDSQQRNTLFAHLTGCFLCQQETVLAQVHISHFSVCTGLEAQTPAQAFDDCQWHSLRVINKQPTDPDGLKIESSQPVLSDYLRIIVDSPKLRVTDRVNVGIGELKIRRNVVASGHELYVLRQPQQDMTCSLSNLAISSNVPKNLEEILEGIKTQESIRAYTFPNLPDLHLFQLAITGFSVLFDGSPASFSISRRRMIVPVHKEWSAPHTRLQILRRGGMFQLAAFFEGFSHGKCMNFALKETDIFKKSTKGGKIYLKIIDAKFSLPPGGKKDFGHEKGFVSLDSLDYPGEHSDICIGFASSSDFTKFSQALPALVKVK